MADQRGKRGHRFIPLHFREERHIQQTAIVSRRAVNVDLILDVRSPQAQRLVAKDEGFKGRRLVFRFAAIRDRHLHEGRDERLLLVTAEFGFRTFARIAPFSIRRTTPAQGQYQRQL